MSTYYHIDKGKLTIISGPHSAQSTYIKKLTHCGNPELLNLDQYGLVPQVYATLADGQKHGAPVVYADRVVIPAVDKSAGELADELQGRIRMMDAAARAHIDRSAHWTAGPMVFDKAGKGKPKSKAIADWAYAVWGLYYQRRAALLAGGNWSDDLLDFSPVGDIPHDMGEALAE